MDLASGWWWRWWVWMWRFVCLLVCFFPFVAVCGCGGSGWWLVAGGSNGGWMWWLWYGWVDVVAGNAENSWVEKERDKGERDKEIEEE